MLVQPHGFNGITEDSWVVLWIVSFSYMRVEIPKEYIVLMQWYQVSCKLCEFIKELGIGGLIFKRVWWMIYCSYCNWLTSNYEFPGGELK